MLKPAPIRRSGSQSLGLLPASAADQDLFLNQTAASGGISKAEHDLLISWSNGEIYLYNDSGGQVVPIILEQPDSTDKTRAFRVDTGGLLLDSSGAAVMIDPTDATSSDVNAMLRKKIQRTLDLLSLADPNPEIRGAMAFKLGSSQKAENLALLETRMKLETDSGVRKTLFEAEALIQLGDTCPPGTASRCRRRARQIELYWSA